MIGAAIGAGILGAGMSQTGNLISQGTQYMANRDLQKRSFEHQKHMARNQYQYMSGDLKKAGINPMLSYMKQASAPSASGASVGMGQSQNPDFAGGIQKLSQARQTNAQTRMTVAQAQEAESNSALTMKRNKWLMSPEGMKAFQAQEMNRMGLLGTSAKGMEDSASWLGSQTPIKDTTSSINETIEQAKQADRTAGEWLRDGGLIGHLIRKSKKKKDSKK